MAELFQKSALDELAAPEQLNQQIKVMKPHMWILFLALVVAFSGVGVWVFRGNINQSIQIDGIVFPQLGVEAVTSDISGTVQDVVFSNGDYVESGDVIAVIPNEECLSLITACEQELQKAQDEEEQEKLKEKLEKLRNKYDHTSMIRAAKSGTLQNMVSMNQKIEPGDQIASVLIDNEASNSREIIGYLPLVNANQLSEGMEAQVCPSYAQREKYGYMKGYISSIGTMPVTMESLQQFYGNTEYIKDILPDTSCVEIRISMYIDDNSRNMFAWSNKNGENLSVDIGTLCDIQIVTENVKPIDLFLP